MLLFDNNIKLEFGQQITGKEYGIFITTTSRRLFLLAKDFFQFIDTIKAFQDAFKMSPYIE